MSRTCFAARATTFIERTPGDQRPRSLLVERLHSGDDSLNGGSGRSVMYKRNSWPQSHGGIIQSLFETFLCLLSLRYYVARNCGGSLIGAPGSARASHT